MPPSSQGWERAWCHSRGTNTWLAIFSRPQMHGHRIIAHSFKLCDSLFCSIVQQTQKPPCPLILSDNFSTGRLTSKFCWGEISYSFTNSLGSSCNTTLLPSGSSEYILIWMCDTFTSLVCLHSFTWAYPTVVFSFWTAYENFNKQKETRVILVLPEKLITFFLHPFPASAQHPRCQTWMHEGRILAVLRGSQVLLFFPHLAHSFAQCSYWYGIQTAWMGGH